MRFQGGIFSVFGGYDQHPGYALFRLEIFRWNAQTGTGKTGIDVCCGIYKAGFSGSRILYKFFTIGSAFFSVYRGLYSNGMRLLGGNDMARFRGVGPN